MIDGRHRLCARAASSRWFNWTWRVALSVCLCESSEYTLRDQCPKTIWAPIINRVVCPNSFFLFLWCYKYICVWYGAIGRCQVLSKCKITIASKTVKLTDAHSVWVCVCVRWKADNDYAKKSNGWKAIRAAPCFVRYTYYMLGFCLCCMFDCLSADVYKQEREREP